jgi:hypothetical protein
LRYLRSSLLALLLVLGFEPVSAETIKKTSQGICHPPTSSYYERTQSFRAFDSVDECLASGGRLPRGLAKKNPIRLTSISGKSYERSAFGHGWDDEDGDCQDSRAEALITTSSTNVHFGTERGCRVVSGRWVSPFTGQVIENSSEIDIDHVVPLKWAWERGASN